MIILLCGNVIGAWIFMIILHCGNVIGAGTFNVILTWSLLFSWINVMLFKENRLEKSLRNVKFKNKYAFIKQAFNLLCKTGSDEPRYSYFILDPADYSIPC